MLAATGLLKGKTCSAYPAAGPDVTLAGGRYADIAVDQAQVDGNLVTAPAWPAHPMAGRVPGNPGHEDRAGGGESNPGADPFSVPGVNVLKYIPTAAGFR